MDNPMGPPMPPWMQPDPNQGQPMGDLQSLYGPQSPLQFPQMEQMPQFDPSQLHPMERMALALHGALGGMPPVNPYANNGDQFGQSLLRGAVGGFIQPSLNRIQGQQQQLSAQQEAVKERNKANIQATLAARNSANATVGGIARDRAKPQKSLADIQAEAMAKARGRAAGTPAKPVASPLGQGEFDQSVEKDFMGNQYVNLGNFHGKVYDAVQKEAAARGIPAVSKEAGTAIQMIDTARQDIETIREAFKQFAPTDAFGRPAVMTRQAFKQLLKSEPVLNAYKSLQLAGIQLGPAIAGGSGSGFRQNKETMNRAIQNDIPKEDDPLPNGNQKLDNLTALLENKRNGLLMRDRSTLPGGKNANPSTDMVRMTDPSGKPYQVHRRDVQASVAHGWKEVQ